MSHKWNTINVNVDIDVDDIIDEIDTEDLLDELKSRKTVIPEMIDDPASLKDLLKYWFTTNKNTNYWAYSDEDLCKIILEEIHK